jgi:hypothetical protein
MFGMVGRWTWFCWMNDVGFWCVWHLSPTLMNWLWSEYFGSCFLLTLFLYLTAADSNTDTIRLWRLLVQKWSRKHQISGRCLLAYWRGWWFHFSRKASDGLEGVKVLSDIGGILHCLFFWRGSRNMVIYLFKSQGRWQRKYLGCVVIILVITNSHRHGNDHGPERPGLLRRIIIRYGLIQAGLQLNRYWLV